MGTDRWAIEMLLSNLGLQGSLVGAFFVEDDEHLARAVSNRWSATGGVGFTRIASDVWDLLRDHGRILRVPPVSSSRASITALVRWD